MKNGDLLTGTWEYMVIQLGGDWSIIEDNHNYHQSVDEFFKKYGLVSIFGRNLDFNTHGYHLHVVDETLLINFLVFCGHNITKLSDGVYQYKK